jgi:hypothetical protein
MHSHTARHLLGTAAAALVLLTGACSDGTGPSTANGAPGTVAGVFDLATVNGNTASTPYKVHEIDSTHFARHFVTAARIVLRPDSTLTISETHKLTITGVNDLVTTVVKQGTFSFEPSEPGAVDNGRIHVTFSNGGERTMELTQVTITDTRMVPGNPGEGDVALQLIYTRD